jgi:gliding motility-associated-like protein
MPNYRLFFTLALSLFVYFAQGQRGKIIQAATSTVMDPNGDGYVSLTTDGFSNDGYYVDEFEITMFGLPVFGDGDTLNDTQAGPNCGTTDLTVDSTGVSAYAALDANNNLIFRLRLAEENNSVEAYTILIDTDGAIGDADSNSTGNNAGFEIDITLIKNSSKGIYVYDIDGVDTCPDPTLEYAYADNFQISIADEVSCGDQDYFYDFYLPFGDLTTEFGITLSSELQFVVLTNISGTCAMAGKISDIGGVDDTEYGGCITCAFDDLSSNQCPVPFTSLLDGGEGFLSGATPIPTMELPLKAGDAIITGTAEPTAELIMDIYDLNDNYLSTETATSDSDSIWTINLGTALVQGDSVTVVAQLEGVCDSGVTGSQISFAVVVLNTTPTINGTGTALAYTENDGLQPVDDAIQFLDNEDFDLVSATFSFTSGFVSTEDELHFTNQNGILGSYNSATGVLTLAGDATIDDYIAAAQSVSYSNNSEEPNEATRTIEIIINDGTIDSGPFSRNITVLAVNDPPVITGTSGSTEFTTETPPFVVNATFSISDADHTQLSSALVQVVESSTDGFVDGDLLTFTNVPGIAGSYNNATGVLTFTGTATLLDYATVINSVEYDYVPPGAANENTRRIDYTVSDGLDDSNVMSHFITFATSTNFPPDVVDENGDPVVGGIDVTTNEDSSVEVCLNVNDPDGDLVTIDNITAALNGTIIQTSDLCFQYTPDANYSGTETVTVTVCDGFGNCDATPVDIEIVVDAVNDPPVLAGSTATVDEKIVTQLCINPGDIFDVEGDTHIFTTGTSANGGTVDDGTAGDLCFDYTPPLNFVGTDQVEVTICDNDDPTVCTTSTINVDVLSVNENPIIYVNGIESTTMTVEMFEDTVKVFCFAVIDVDGDNVSTTTINQISGNGTLIETATEFCYEYSPALNDNGTAVFEITIEDDAAAPLSDMVTVTLNIAAVNDPPTLNAIADPTAIDEDASDQTINLTGISAGGGETQTLSVSATSDNTSLIQNPTITYTPSNPSGTLTYTPLVDQFGTAIITVTVDDSQAANNIFQQTFTVTVNPINDQPTLDVITDPLIIDEDAPEQTINLSGISAGGGEAQTLAINVSSDNPALIPNPALTHTDGNATGSLAFTPVANQSGTANITVTLDDGQATNNTIQQVFTVQVNAVNDQPTLNSIADPLAISEDAPQQIINLAGISAGGGENQTLTITATSDNPTLINPTVTYTSSNATGSLSYTPVANQFGTAIITVTVDDGASANNTNIQTFTVSVSPVNDQPTLDAISDPAAINEDAAEQTINLSGISPGPAETQTLAISATSDNPALIPNPTITYNNPDANGTLVYTPVADQFGTATVTLTVDDGEAIDNTIIETFTVTVLSINDQPTLDAITDPLIIDEDAPEQTINLSGISAGGGEAQTLTVNISTDNATLIPNPTLTYTSGSSVGSIAYTPTADLSGTATITIIIDDGQSTNNILQQDITITVTEINDQPTLDAISDPAVIDEDAPEQTINLSGITAGGGENQILTVTAVSGNTSLIPNPIVNYTNSNTNGFLSYTPAADQFGTTIITVTVDDGQTLQGTIQQDFTVTVNGVNDPPVIDITLIEVDEKITSNICVSVSDIENDSHQFISGTSLTANAIITNETAGDLCFEYTPPVDFTGSDQIEVSICDINDPSVCTTSTINIEVIDVNEPPVFLFNGLEVNSIELDGLEDTPMDFCLGYNDPEGDNVITSSFSNLQNGGTLVENSSPLCYTYNPEENVNGLVIWELEICDDGSPSQCSTVFVEIDLENVNDEPVSQPDTLEVKRKEPGSINVLINDSDIDGDDLTLGDIIETPSGGSAVLSSDGTITYTSAVTFRGTDQLTYTVQDSGNPIATTTEVLVIIVDDNPFTVYQTISPNGDGINDYWHIEGIDFYPNNQVKLFDRYNNLVFLMSGYDNSDKIWNGRRNQGSGGELEDGTYYYQVLTGNEEFTGFVVLRTK